MAATVIDVALSGDIRETFRATTGLAGGRCGENICVITEGVAWIPALLAAIQIHIKQLRNRRDVEVHWPAFQVLVAENTASVLALSSRWLISVCDTFADYGTPVERRNALLLSMFVNMIRVADTYRYLLDQLLIVHGRRSYPWSGVIV